MLAFISVWLGLISLLVAVAMAVYRPVFTDLAITFVLYLGTPGALCLAGLTLWAHRHDDTPDPGLAARRLQAKVAIAMALAAAAITYALVIGAAQVDPIEG